MPEGITNVFPPEDKRDVLLPPWDSALSLFILVESGPAVRGFVKDRAVSHP
jgi:hypothetical protein